MGDITQIHDHFIIPQSFKTINATVNIPVNPIVLPVVFIITNLSTLKYNFYLYINMNNFTPKNK